MYVRLPVVALMILASRPQRLCWLAYLLYRLCVATTYCPCDSEALLTTDEIAALTFFTAVAGSSLWRLVRFFTHQIRTRSANPVDGLYHAHNIVLRNGGSTEKAVWDALNIGFAWRKSAASSLSRSFVLALLALTVLCMVTTSSVLSSKVVLSHHALGMIVSSNCGPLHDGNSDVTDQAKNIEESNTATQYVRSCYQSSQGSQCNSTYVVQNLPYNVTTGAKCPFDDELCTSPDGGVIFDTGLLDSRTHLGLNTGDDARVFLRRLTSCSPLQTQGHTAFLVDNTTGINIGYWAAYYGQNEAPGDGSTHNETYRVLDSSIGPLQAWNPPGYILG